MLDKKILGFRQTVRDFLKSKTNQAALVTIISTSVAFHMGEVSASVAVSIIMPAFFAIFIKDATVK